jgi:hypothetical protein
MDSIKLVLAIATARCWEVHHMESSFLHGYLEEEIYMDQPHGYIQDSPSTDQVARHLHQVLHRERFRDLQGHLGVVETSRGDFLVFLSSSSFEGGVSHVVFPLSSLHEDFFLYLST